MRQQARRKYKERSKVNVRDNRLEMWVVERYNRKRSNIVEKQRKVGPRKEREIGWMDKRMDGLGRRRRQRRKGPYRYITKVKGTNTKGIYIPSQDVQL